MLLGPLKQQNLILREIEELVLSPIVKCYDTGFFLHAIFKWILY